MPVDARSMSRSADRKVRSRLDAYHSRSRYYIDVPLTEKREDWSDEPLWDELGERLGTAPAACSSLCATAACGCAATRPASFRRPEPKG